MSVCPTDSVAGCGSACAAATFVAVSIITLLVVGILGSQGVIHMSPSTAHALIGISVAFVLGMVTACVKCACGIK